MHTVVGCLHTYVVYDPSYANDTFSSADKRNAERQGVPTYVATLNPEDGKRRHNKILCSGREDPHAVHRKRKQQCNVLLL